MYLATLLIMHTTTKAGQRSNSMKLWGIQHDMVRQTTRNFIVINNQLTNTFYLRGELGQGLTFRKDVVRDEDKALDKPWWRLITSIKNKNEPHGAIEV